MTALKRIKNHNLDHTFQFSISDHKIKSTFSITIHTTGQSCQDKVQHNTEHNGDHLHVEEGEDQVKLNPEHHDAHLRAEEGEDSQTPLRTACGSPA